MTTQERIVLMLREKSGALVDAFDVADRIGTALDVPADRIEIALRTLENRGFLTRENKRTVTLTETGWTKDVAAPAPDDHPAIHTQGTPERTQPTATPLAVVPEPAQRKVTSIEKPKEKVMGKGHVKDRIVAELERRGGRIDDADGKCVPILASALDAETTTIAFGLGELATKGLVVKESKRGIGTMSIALTNGKGATNGEVQGRDVRSRDRVRPDTKRKDATVRREAAEGDGAVGRVQRRARRRPARKGSGAARGVPRAVRSEGRGHVDPAPHDVSGRPDVQAELDAIGVVVALPAASRLRVIAYLTSVIAEGQEL